MSADPQQDPAVLDIQYANATNLGARQSLYAYAVDPVPHHSWVLDLIPWRGDEAVLDLGCGNGVYSGPIRDRASRGTLVSVDRSPGMLGVAPPAPKACADAQQLPFAPDSFDVVLAAHMLYHVPDRAAALREIRRVLRPGGVALVVTNSEQHLQELFTLIGSPGVPWTLENGGPDLRAVFSRVERHDLLGRLEISELEPVVAYVDSMMTSFDRARGVEAVAVAIARDGSLSVRTAMGCFVCR